MKMSKLGVPEGSASRSAFSVASARRASLSCLGDRVFGALGTGATTSSTRAGGGRKVAIHEGIADHASEYTPESEAMVESWFSMAGTRSGATEGLKSADGYSERRYASRPAVWGEAIDVPERVETESLLPM